MRQGFSLVELSIVLVILGLLTGGILTGQNLIRAAELRSVTTQVTTLQVAYRIFQDKYFALPGDMRNATDFWEAAGTCAAPHSDVGTGTQTCNGNGNGKIADAPVPANGYESFRAWQHLANAGLIEGSYTGVSANAASRDSIAGSNIPATKISNGGIFVRDLGVVTSSIQTFDGNYGHTLLVGSDEVASGLPQDPLFTASELWGVDKKLDDGLPGLGRVRTYRPANSPDCAVDENDYDLTKTTISCSLMVLLGL